MFLLELAENQSTERQQTWLWESCDILSQGYPRTFRATDKRIFRESSKCITGYQIKDLLRVPPGLFFNKTVCSILKNWWQSARELREPTWGAKGCLKFMIHSLSSISQKSYWLLLTHLLHLTRNRSTGKYSYKEICGRENTS